ncbi:MAG: TraR/DksA family transcriptional regulator [Bdellovibrionales bacterium]|nr:TraR/DksA family transcriptional regulator [Bdellovibrionales bacterium]
MTTNQLAVFRAKIRTNLIETERKVFSLRGDLLETAEVQPSLTCDLNDHAKEEGELGARLGIHSVYLQQKKQLQDALLKIEKGTFGKCDCCGEEIAMKRLEVQPIAILCLSCQKSEELAPKIPERSVAWISPERFNCLYVGVA